MTILIFSALVGLAALVAGFLGALTGLGGGVVPLLTLVFGVEIRYAMGASLVSVIATSSGAAVAYVKERSEMAPIYDPDTVTTLRGTATAVTVVPARGGGMGGVHVTLSSDGQAMDVHLGPAWFLDREGVAVSKGDAVEVNGSVIDLNGEAFLIARELKAGKKVVKLRDEQGIPAWAGRRP